MGHIFLPSEAHTRHTEEFYIWAASWQNQQNGMCAQRRLRSAQSLCCALNGLLRTQAFFMWTAKTQADLSLRWVHSHIVGFVMRRLIWSHNWPIHVSSIAIGSCSFFLPMRPTAALQDDATALVVSSPNILRVLQTSAQELMTLYSDQIPQTNVLRSKPEH